MPYHEAVKQAATGTTAKAAGGASAVFAGIDVATGKGLDVAANVAGAVLEPIFGGLPWDMSPDAIVDAVTGGGGGNASEAATLVIDVAVTVI